MNAATNIGVTLTADDQQLIAVLNSIEGHLARMSGAAKNSMAGVSAAAGSAGAAFKNLGAQSEMSAKQMNAALRGVPAQFTDIFTSLQGGQSPLTVLLQQGGQLKDMFGGVGAAAKALGGYVLGLVNPFTLAAAAVGVLAYGLKAGSDEQRATEKQLILTGRAAGVTAGQVADMAREISGLGNGTIGNASAALNTMAASGIRGGAALMEFTNTAIMLERAGGPAIEKTAEAFAALAKNPTQASKTLNEQTGYLTASLYAQIKSLEGQGRATEAAALAQRAFADAQKLVGQDLEKNLGFVDKFWRGIVDSLKEAVGLIKEVGRGETTTAALERVQASLAVAKSRKFGKEFVPGLSQESQNLERAAGYEQMSAFYAAKATESNKAGAKWIEDQNGYLSKQEQLERNIVRIRNEGKAAGADDNPEVLRAMERRIALERERADPGVNLQKIKDAESLRLEIISRNQDAIAAKRNMGAISERDAIRETSALEMQAFAVRRAALDAEIKIVSGKQDSQRETAALRGQRELLGAQQITAEAEARAKLEAITRKQYLAAAAFDIERQTELQSDYAKAITDEYEARSKVRMAAYEYAKEVESESKALEFERSLIAMSNEERTKRIALYKIEVELNKKLEGISKTGDQAFRDAEEKKFRATAAKQAANVETKAYIDEWSKAWDQLYNGLSDALIRGFESGKEGIASLKTALQNMLRNLVVKPMVDGFLKQISGLLQGAVGSIGGSTSSGVVGGIAGLLGAGYSYASTYAGSTYNTSAGSQQSRMLADQEAGMAGKDAAAAAGNFNVYAAIAAATYGEVLKDQKRGFNAQSARDAGGAGKVFAETSNLMQKIGLNKQWADILSMSTGFARMFGRGAKEGTASGISGTFSGGGADAIAFQDWKQKGGWFRSDKTGTDTAALDDRQKASLAGSSKAAFDAVNDWAKVLRLPAEKLSEVTHDIRLTLGDDATKNAEAIAAEIQKYQDKLSDSLAGSIKPLMKAGETATEALKRLSMLTTFSEDLNQLGGIFSKLAGQSVGVRETFIALAGGMDALRSQAASFVQNYYNRDEIAGIKAREIQQALGGVGITQDISTKEQFRALVEGVDLTTENGQKQLATLLQAQQSFLDVSQYLTEQGSGTLGSVAGQAPGMGAIGGLLTGAEQAQIDATNSVADAVNEVRDAVMMLVEQTQTTTGMIPSRAWEVNGDAPVVPWSPGNSDGP